MYRLVADWEEATDRADALVARIDAVRRAGIAVPATLLEALAVAEDVALRAAQALRGHGDPRSQDRVLH